MKQYRLKMSTPWANEGAIYDADGRRVGQDGIYPGYGRETWCNSKPEKWPEYFEKVKSDEPVLIDFLVKNAANFSGDSNNIYQRMARALIEKGFDVNRIRDEA